MKSINDYLKKEEVLDNKEVISLSTLENMIKGRVSLLKKEFSNFREICECFKLYKDMYTKVFNNGYVPYLVTIHTNSVVEKEKTNIYLDLKFSIPSSWHIYGGKMCRIWDKSTTKKENVVISRKKGSKSPEISGNYNKRYDEFFADYNDELNYIMDTLEEGYNYFGECINENCLSVFKDGVYKDEFFKVTNDEDLNLKLCFKDLSGNVKGLDKKEIFKKIPISVSKLSDNIQNILKANENYNVEYDFFLGAIENSIDEKKEIRNRINDIYDGFVEKYGILTKDIDVSKDVLEMYEKIKNKMYKIETNTYFEFMDIVNNSKKHYIDKSDICNLSNDFDNLLCAVNQTEVMPGGNVVVDRNGCVSRVSGNIVVKSEDDKHKIMVKRK